MATAESCTGGLIAKRLTDRSGSSAYLSAAQSPFKCRQADYPGCGRSGDGGSRRGQEPVARRWRRRADLFGTDVALSVTGIAGPAGGTETKPVGLTFVGLSAADGTWARRLVFGGNRIQNRDSAADAALHLLLEYLDGVL
jgi:nicotinamide-nucleotide amidase